MSRSRDIRRLLSEAEHGRYESDDATALYTVSFRQASLTCQM